MIRNGAHSHHQPESETSAIQPATVVAIRTTPRTRSPASQEA